MTMSLELVSEQGITQSLVCQYKRQIRARRSFDGIREKTFAGKRPLPYFCAPLRAEKTIL